MRKRSTAVVSVLALVICMGLMGMSTANAKSAEQRRADKIVAAWANWVKDAKAGASAIAVSYNGKLIAEMGISRDARTPFPVASLSKAITGICVAKLVEEGKFAYDTKLSDIVKEPSVGVTLGSLLNHTSGFLTDVTQSSLRWVDDRSKENLQLIVSRELKKGKRDAEGARYSYNNVNYHMLGLAIAEVTNSTYETACNEIVLKPIGIETARLNPDWALLASAGGWMISAVDYLKFVDHYFADKGVLGVAPTDRPFHAFDGGAHYGMGYLFRKGRGGGYQFWHTGAWDWRGGPKKDQFSAYFAKWENGWAVSVNADRFPGFEALGKLDQGLWNASWR